VRSLSIALLISTVLAAGCSKDPESLDRRAAAKFLVSECPMSIREVMDNGQLSTRPFIRPEHVARLDPAPKPFRGDDPAMFVT